MRQTVDNLFSRRLTTTIMKYGANMLFVGAILVLSYLSFVDNFNINPSARNITILSIAALALNWVVWDMCHKKCYKQALDSDLMNADYCIHKRYYLARKNCKEQWLQERIREYNRLFLESWKMDVEDETGRYIKDTTDECGVLILGIKNGGYKHHSHKLLIWRIKHNAYPKSGIKSPRQLLNVLSVGSSGSMKMVINKAEHMHASGRVKKLFTSALGTFFAGALVYDFISGNWESAILKLVINVGLLFMSWLFGSLSGASSGQVKLAITEDICGLFEEWKNEVPTEVPFKDNEIASLPIPQIVPAEPEPESKGIQIDIT